MDFGNNSYDLGIMSGCLKGHVPTLIDLNEAIRNHTPVKYIVVATHLPIYGYIQSNDEIMQCIDFRPDPQSLITNLRLDGIILFYAVPLSKEIEVEKGRSIIVGDEMFTVVNSNEHGMSVWIGNQGLVYYGEDIQSIINEQGGYTAIEIPL